MTSDDEISTSVSSTSSIVITTPLDPHEDLPKPTSDHGDRPDDAQKIKAIIEEYGEISSLFEEVEPERMLAESQGSLFK